MGTHSSRHTVVKTVSRQGRRRHGGFLWKFIAQRMILLLALLLGRCFSFASALLLDGKVVVPTNYSLYHAPVEDPNAKMEVLLDLVITEIIDLDFAKSRITLNIEFILSWKD